MPKLKQKIHSLYAALVLLVLVANAAPTLASDTVITDPDKFSTWAILGPPGGDVRVVTIDPKNKDHLFISTLDGQVYTSTDAGKSWRLLVNLNRPQLILDQLMVDSQDSNVIYTSGHRYKAPGGFFVTRDGGATWKEAKELRNESIHAMSQSTADPKSIVLGTLDGVWISKNSGDDFEKIDSTSMPVNIDSMAVDPRNTSTMYAGTWWRAYKTTDSGKNWRLIKDGMIDDSDVFAVNIDPRDADHIIASACSGIYESHNGGEKWAKIQGIPSQSRRTRDIVQHPSVPGTVYAATTEGFWMSTNSGKTWILTTQRNLEVNSIAVHPDEPNRVYIGTNNYGVMVSNDGGKNFVQTNDNFTSRFTYSITPDSERADRVYAITQNTATSGGFFFISDDGGKNWVQSKNLDINRITSFSLLQDRTNTDLMYLGTNVGVFRSTDRGMSWTLLKPPPLPKKKPVARKTTAKGKTAAAAKPKPPAEPATSPAPVVIPALQEKVRTLSFTEDGKNGILAATDTGLYRTYDIDKGWEKLDFGNGVNTSVFNVHIAPGESSTIWVGTSAGVIVSKDDGKTWTKVDGIPSDIPVSSIATDPKRPDHVYVGNTQSLYLSRDGGKTWIRRGGNLPLGNYTSILINPENTDEIYISSSLESDGGVFYSKDAGMKWKRMDSKDMRLPSRRVWSMVFDPRDPNRIFAASHSSGVYRIERQIDTAKADDEAKTAVTGN
jgi:photosystem II stability/assembly factor-like uncharacterized protein